MQAIAELCNFKTLFISAFKPNFFKSPLPESIAGALLGNITIPCEPEGAPRAEIKWMKNGANLGVSTGSTGTGRLQLLPNNFLLIQQLSMGDAGVYACVATNSLGSATSYCRLNVQSRSKVI